MRNAESSIDKLLRGVGVVLGKVTWYVFNWRRWLKYRWMKRELDRMKKANRMACLKCGLNHPTKDCPANVPPASMDLLRWLEVNREGEGLNDDELKAGWHFCMDWDGLLVGPGMPENESCHCKRGESTP